jgi:hypothetical protein
MTPKETLAFVDFHISALLEHFDAVQILASRSDHEGTHDVMRGGGNWYACQGMAHDFITRDRAQSEAHEWFKLAGGDQD